MTGNWHLIRVTEAVESRLKKIHTAGTNGQEVEKRQGEPKQHDKGYDYEYMMGNKVTNTEDVIDEEDSDNKEDGDNKKKD